MLATCLSKFMPTVNVKRVIHFSLLCLFCLPGYAMCPSPFSVQVLGSGGPIADDDRASSGYLIWIDNKARILVDAGGGIALRYGQSHAKIEHLDAIALTHLHADHSAALPALLKSSYFSDRSQALPLFGPSGNVRWPSIEEFTHGLFNSKTGIYRYLDGYLTGSDGMFQIKPQSVNSESATQLVQLPHFSLSAVSVHHGPVPAVAYLIESKGKRIAISGDQSNHNPAFAKMIKNADVLVMANAIPEHAGSVAKKLHATPAYIGALAQKAGVKKLILSHFMQRSIATQDENIALIKQTFKGPVQLAQDLHCYAVD